MSSWNARNALRVQSRTALIVAGVQRPLVRPAAFRPLAGPNPPVHKCAFGRRPGAQRVMPGLAGQRSGTSETRRPLRSPAPAGTPIRKVWDRAPSSWESHSIPIFAYPFGSRRLCAAIRCGRTTAITCRSCDRWSRLGCVIESQITTGA
jgi:hypothetical protein